MHSGCWSGAQMTGGSAVFDVQGPSAEGMKKVCDGHVCG